MEKLKHFTPELKLLLKDFSWCTTDLTKVFFVGRMIEKNF